MSIIFQDRMGNRRQLAYYHGETLENVLTRHHIPVSSVISTVEDEPVAESVLIRDERDYTVKLIEGYDIGTIISSVFPEEHVEANYVKNRVVFDLDGSLITEHVPMTCGEVVEMVEDNIRFAIQNYQLIEKGEKVLVGLSGGVDSSSLLIALTKLSKEMGFTVIAATFEDFDSLSSPTFTNAKNLAASLGVEHKLIPSDTIEKAFHLNKPLRLILPEMMGTEYNPYAMYTDHHTTRRALELFSDEIGADKIILGLHTTDLVAGLLNAYTTGYQMANMFKREVGRYTYIYPLMFVPKKELHIYFYYYKQKYAVHSYPNAWEINPKDRNYYYYLADQLQTIFPGLENYLFEAHSWQLKRQKGLHFTQCKNCGSHILQQEYVPVNDGCCDVCNILMDLGYIEGDEEIED